MAREITQSNNERIDCIMVDRDEHCAFALLNMDGKCIAKCAKNIFVDGFMIDCIGTKSNTIEEFSLRVEAEVKLH